ncbi:hypothetical protein ASZ90_017128 [hydrocarbon metagenome]|uniref:Uncharacterized protein n=1 Tax=hydrocarbon metagenome TaxID=938273 RepID=A0A0W8EAE8_9ZZZZ
MVGKTGVFETLAVALGYLDQPDICACPYFADLALENSRKILKVGEKRGQELFVVGFKAPDIIFQINQDFISLSEINGKDRLQTVPISIKGENTTFLLSKLANIPIIGYLFLSWAKRRTLGRLPYLLEYGKNLRMENSMDSRDKKESTIAAKPYRK